jgi:hypothetical protein
VSCADFGVTTSDNKILREEKEILKKAALGSTGQRPAWSRIANTSSKEPTEKSMAALGSGTGAEEASIVYEPPKLELKLKTPPSTSANNRLSPAAFLKLATMTPPRLSSKSKTAPAPSVMTPSRVGSCASLRENADPNIVMSKAVKSENGMNVFSLPAPRS